jgi:formylglycine-generating enzyme required for sulfatase activity
MLNATTADRTFKVGGREVKLSEVAAIQFQPAVRVVLQDGKVVEGVVSGLEAVPVQFGEQSLPMNLVKAAAVRFGPAAETGQVSYTLVVRQGKKEILRQTERLAVEGLLPTPAEQLDGRFGPWRNMFVTTPGPLGMKFVSLPKATFYMGWNGQKGSARKTEIKEDFEIAIHTVTQGQWQAVMGSNPSWFSRDGGGKEKVKDIKDQELKQFPVEKVSWNDAQEFIKKLNEKEKGGGYLYRLPSEAEWEYSCRGGASSEEECSYHFYFAKPTNDLSCTQANFHLCVNRPTKVGSYAPNKLGLYDMHGNEWQWTSTEEASNWVIRGGSWGNAAGEGSAGFRWRHLPDYRDEAAGFRLARVRVR